MRTQSVSPEVIDGCYPAGEVHVIAGEYIVYIDGELIGIAVDVGADFVELIDGVIADFNKS